MPSALNRSSSARFMGGDAAARRPYLKIIGGFA